MANLIEHFTKEDCMSSEEARQIVEDGLERRKIERERRDAELENQERMLRLKINDNHTVKTLTEIQRLNLQKEEERKQRAERAQHKAEMVIKDMKAEDTVNKFGIFCIFMILLAIVSRLNIFVLLATVLGAAVFPVIRISKIYGLV
jgi:hypothetical protein